MGFLKSRFTQAVGIFVLAFVVLRFGIRPPAPWSVLRLYMTIIAMALRTAAAMVNQGSSKGFFQQTSRP